MRGAGRRRGRDDLARAVLVEGVALEAAASVRRAAVVRGVRAGVALDGVRPGRGAAERLRPQRSLRVCTG